MLGRGADDGRQAWIGWHVGQLEDAAVRGGGRRGSGSQLWMMRRRERGVSHEPAQFYIVLTVVLFLFLLLLLFLRHLEA